MPRHILLVDDEADVLASLRDLLLVVPDCTVETAASYAEGTVKAAGRAWDLIICDERMPDGSGLDLLARVAKTAPATRLILMTAYQDFGIAVRAINQAKVDEFIEKPWDPDAMVQRVTHMLQERPSRAPANLQARTFRRIGGPPAGPGTRP